MMMQNSSTTFSEFSYSDQSLVCLVLCAINEMCKSWSGDLQTPGIFSRAEKGFLLILPVDELTTTSDWQAADDDEVFFERVRVCYYSLCCVVIVVHSVYLRLCVCCSEICCCLDMDTNRIEINTRFDFKTTIKTK